MERHHSISNFREVMVEILSQLPQLNSNNVTCRMWAKRFISCVNKLVKGEKRSELLCVAQWRRMFLWVRWLKLNQRVLNMILKFPWHHNFFILRGNVEENWKSYCKPLNLFFECESFNKEFCILILRKFFSAILWFLIRKLLELFCARYRKGFKLNLCGHRKLSKFLRFYRKQFKA